mmetsp:Transcript_17649/g.39844  ORF Transcript_17649/g.39844 Transcript_17649/m.39844 type:complete len:258 (-) Transcript_17649:114-887(-)
MFLFPCSRSWNFSSSALSTCRASDGRCTMACGLTPLRQCRRSFRKKAPPAWPNPRPSFHPGSILKRWGRTFRLLASAALFAGERSTGGSFCRCARWAGMEALEGAARGGSLPGVLAPPPEAGSFGGAPADRTTLSWIARDSWSSCSRRSTPRAPLTFVILSPGRTCSCLGCWLFQSFTAPSLTATTSSEPPLVFSTSKPKTLSGSTTVRRIKLVGLPSCEDPLLPIREAAPSWPLLAEPRPAAGVEAALRAEERGLE